MGTRSSRRIIVWRENYRSVTVQVRVNKVFDQLVAKQVSSSSDDHLSKFLTA